ncbi:MAG TPA: hypothetical protein VGX28_04295 [Frankiaceae bacterium]|jgi:hypothetical protein|nr:hypothetical protein [Frankiaceae bacterium]
MPRSPLVRRPKLRLIAAVAALAATVPIAASQAEDIRGATCAFKGNVGQVGKSWQTFKSPRFVDPQGLGAAAQDIAAYGVSPKDPNLLAVTNGNSIQISSDGGCTWAERLRLDQVPRDASVPLSGQFTKIRNLHILSNGRVIALAEELDTGATVGRPHVLLSDGDQRTWRLGDSGLPPVGEPLLLKAHPDAPNVLYLSFRSAKAPEGGPGGCLPPPVPCAGSDDSNTPGLLWGSTDGGQTWTRRTDPNDLNGAAVIRYFSVEDDDATGRTLWVVSNGQLRKSTNGGASFSVPDGLDQSGFNFTAVESINAPTKLPNPVKVLAFSSGGEMIRLEGAKWIRSRIPFGAVESVSQRQDGDIAVATQASGGGVTVWRIFGYSFKDYEYGDRDNPLRFKMTYGWQSITPPTPIGVNAKISAATGGSVSTYFLRDKRRILRFLGTRITDDTTIAPPVIGVDPPPPLGRITPSNLTLNLPLGREQTVDYTLTVPPAPTPIDLYLLIDNSGSMQPLIEELKRSLGEVAVSLVRSGVNVKIGVGQINVQPDRQELPIDDPNTPDRDESKPRPVYERLREIGDVNGTLFTQLSKIDGFGGSGDEAQLESLWQAAVGDGYDSLGLGPLTGYNVKPDQDARWRTGGEVVRVIVHATDEKFSTNIRGGHNDARVVAEQLHNMGIRQIGLSQGVPDAHHDLEEMARLTGALAPPGGTDCDGDNRVDIKAGEPLVCRENYGLDKTLVNLIKALQDPQDLEVQVSDGVTLKKTTSLNWRINAKNATKVGFKVTYSCKGVAPGSYTHDLKAGLRNLLVAKAVTTVNCGTPPLRPVRPDSVANQPPNQPPPIQPQPVPAPIAPVQPVPQPQTQVQNQPQVNPQAGAAEQKQKQIQVALAENDIGIQDEDQLAMVGLSNERHTAPATAVVIAGMAMASACAGAVAYRRRTQVAQATIH